jgi:hypothetical protein
MQWREGLKIGKYPDSAPYYEFDIGAELTSIGDTVDTYDVTADTGLTVSDVTLQVGTESGVANAGIRFKLSGGSEGTEYVVTLTVVTATNAETIIKKVTFYCGRADGVIVVGSARD